MPVLAPNWHDDFVQALAEHAVSTPHVPNPVNLWMNVPVNGGEVELLPPVSRPGDHVVLTAEMDVYVVFSTCPMDVTPVNGEDRTPGPVHYARRPVQSA